VELTIDIAVTLVEISSMTAEEIFVGSCLFICEKNNKEGIVEWLEERCGGAMGVGL